MVKTDQDENSVWQKTFGGDVFDSLSDVIRLRSDGYAIMGFTFSGARAKKIFWPFKIDDSEKTSCGASPKAEKTLKKPTTFTKLANRNLF
jgi:hypothetical protein